MVFFALALALQGSQDLESVAKRLSPTGGIAQVRNDHGRPEIWFDLNGPIKTKTLSLLSGVSHLTSVRIFSEDLTDAMVEDIKNNPNLNLLVIMSSKLTDKCTEPISKMKGLIKLDLNRATLTKKGIERVAKLPRLERLYLYNAKVKDIDLAPLMQAKQLKVLDLPPTIRETTLAEFRAALPKTAVECRRTNR